LLAEESVIAGAGARTPATRFFKNNRPGFLRKTPKLADRCASRQPQRGQDWPSHQRDAGVPGRNPDLPQACPHQLGGCKGHPGRLATREVSRGV